MRQSCGQLQTREQMASPYKSPLVAGVSQLANWSLTVTVEEGLSTLGYNSGNMMFTEAIFRTLKGAARTSFSLPPEALEGRDCIVLAAANWINSYEDFGWLADVIERTNLPVFLIGVGAQAPLDMSIPTISVGTKRLLDIVAERSTSISARGTFSCEVLNHYGIKSVVATGCPSLLLLGPNGPAITQPPKLDRVVLHATRHGFGRCDEMQRFLYSQAMKHGYDILLQSEAADIYFALGRTNNASIVKKASQAVIDAYGVPDASGVSAYLRKHGLFFINYPSWINSMKNRSFCLGTRIHGTVAAIIAGIPAVLIAHDARTIEMAQAMNIPYIVASSIPMDRDLDLAVYANNAVSSDLVRGYPVYRSKFFEYFNENGLPLN